MGPAEMSAGNRARLSDDHGRHEIEGVGARALPCGTRTVDTRQRTTRAGEARRDGDRTPRHLDLRAPAASSTSPPTRSAAPARRSTRSTSTRSPTATPAPTCSSPSRRRGDALRDGRRRPAPTCPWATRLAVLSRGALLGARGNSGVILSQMLGAYADRLRAGVRRRAQRPDRRRGDAAGHRRELRGGGPPGRGHHPHRRARRLRRGAAPRGRRTAPGPGTSSPRPRAAAREALAHTPEQLRQLADAGVVDAGGRGPVRGPRRRRDRLHRSPPGAGDPHRRTASRCRTRSPATTSPRTARPTR